MTPRNKFEAFLVADPHQLYRTILPLIVFVLTLGLTYTLWLDARKNSIQALKTDFVYRQLEAAQHVRQRMLDYDQMLRGLRGLFRASDNVNRDEFHEYYLALNTSERYKGVQALTYIQHVPYAEKNQHITEMKKEGFSDYRVLPNSQREYAGPVVFIEPFDKVNQRAFGFDISSDPTRRTAMEAARDANGTFITKRVSLVQGDKKDKSATLILLLPVYKKGVPHNTVESRRIALVGWVDAVLSIEPLMAGVLGVDDPEIDIEIFDGKELSPASCMTKINFCATIPLRNCCKPLKS